MFQGDVKKLTDDVAALKPSLFVAVPRVLERIQSGIVMKLKQKNWIVRFLFNIAYSMKLRAIKSGKPVDKASLSLRFSTSSYCRFYAQAKASQLNQSEISKGRNNVAQISYRLVTADSLY